MINLLTYYYLRYASAVYMLSSCVRPLSQVCVLLKWLITGSCKQRHKITQGLYSFLKPKVSAKFEPGHGKWSYESWRLPLDSTDIALHLQPLRMRKIT